MIKNSLLKYGKKIIDLEDLRSLLKISDSTIEDLYNLTVELVKNGYLEPVKASGQNGNRKYPLHKKYRITVEDKIDSKTSEQIEKLHPALLKSGYLLSHSKDYTDNTDVIEKLNIYLFEKNPEIPVSRKERSFEIFGCEKILDDSIVKTLLKKLNISKEDLLFYDTPEYCFHDYIPER